MELKRKIMFDLSKEEISVIEDLCGLCDQVTDCEECPVKRVCKYGLDSTITLSEFLCGLIDTIENTKEKFLSNEENKYE